MSEKAVKLRDAPIMTHLFSVTLNLDRGLVSDFYLVAINHNKRLLLTSPAANLAVVVVVADLVKVFAMATRIIGMRVVTVLQEAT